jgi:peroxiredoxin
MTTSFGGQSQSRWGDNTVNAHEPMRDLLLFDTTGTPRATADARKKGMLVLAFFKTTCPTCQMTFPYLQKLHDAYAAAADGGKVSVWGISQDDGDATTAFAQKYGVTFPLLLDRDLWHSMSYGIVSVPTVYLADSDGTVLRKVAGWDRAAVNEIGERVAAFLEREPVPIVAADDPVVATRPG